MASTPQQQQQQSRAALKAAERRERLRRSLPATVELLQSRQADRIDDADIDAYVSLNWLEWQRLRPVGTHRNGLKKTPQALRPAAFFR